MAASTRRDLYLQVSANIDNMSAALKAGRSVLAQFGNVAIGTTDEVQAAFKKLGGGSIEQSARSIEATYAKTFATIKANARAVIDAPTPQAALGIVNVAAAEQAASAAEAQAAGLRLVADAAQRAALATQGDATANRVYAVAAEAAAVGAAEQAAALRAQAGVLASVRTQLGVTVDAEDEVAGAHNRLGASGLIADHVIRSFTDSITAGQSPIRAFALELPRVAEAMQFFAASTEATEGAVGKFAGFMGGPWGVALTAGIALLAPFAAGLLEADDATKKTGDDLEKAAQSADSFGNAQSELGKILDLTTGKLKTHNEVLVQTIRLQAQANLLAAQQAERDDRKAVAGAGEGSVFSGRSFGTRGVNAETIHNTALTAIAQKFLGGGSLDEALSAVDKLTASQLAGFDPIKFKSGLLSLGKDRNDQKAQQEVIDAIDGKGLSPDLVPYEKPKKPRKPRADHSAERAANDDRAYQAQLAQAQDAYARAMLALSDTAEGRLKVETDELQFALQQKLLEIDDQVKAKKINQAQADKLKALAVDTEALQEQAAKRKEMSDILQAQLQHEELQLKGAADLLNLQSSLATTTKERRDLALRLLANEEAQARAEANKVLADPTSTPDQRSDAQAKLDQVGQQHDPRTRQINQQYADPLQAYLLQLHQATDDTNAALQGVEVDGLKGLEDGLLGIISGTESVASAFKKMAASIISDLARIAIEKAIAGIFGSLLGGGNLLGSLGGGGGGSSLPFGGARATGGPIANDNFYLVGENGPELFAPGMSGSIIPNHALANLSLPDLSAGDMRGLARGGGVAVQLGDIHLSAPGADPAQLARLQAAFQQSQQELPARVVAAVTDAQSRRMIR